MPLLLHNVFSAAVSFGYPYKAFLMPHPIFLTEFLLSVFYLSSYPSPFLLFFFHAFILILHTVILYFL